MKDNTIIQVISTYTGKTHTATKSIETYVDSTGHYKDVVIYRVAGMGVYDEKDFWKHYRQGPQP